MAWTTPRTWNVGELVTDARLNEQLRDNMIVLKTALTDDGKIIALTSTYFDNLSGADLTGVAKTGANTDYTGGVQNFNGGGGTRLVLPVGADKWAT
jgi:hypothetical protein